MKRDDTTAVVPLLDEYAVFGEFISSSTFPKTRPGIDAPSAIEIKRMAIRFERFLYRAVPGTFYRTLREALVRREASLEAYRKENAALVEDQSPDITYCPSPEAARYVTERSIPYTTGNEKPEGDC